MTHPFPDLDRPNERISFTPTREAGLKRLDQFASRAGKTYARTRNFDFGPDHRSNVSALSPWLRHRLITEQDVLTRVLAAHGKTAARKFIQEIFWRTYFKGWLEHHPSVWSSYQKGLLSANHRIERDAELRTAYQDATAGATGIDCFDHWTHELVSTGYLHNHARMWMASIWIFTLRLPWELGADFFLRHLIDGDPASNTLGWRWVAGLHTKGRHYLARPNNIARYTDGRFDPRGLVLRAEPLTENSPHPQVEVAASVGGPPDRYLALVTEDDMTFTQPGPTKPVGTVGIVALHGRSPHPVGAQTARFVTEGMNQALAPLGCSAQTQDDWSDVLIRAAREHGVSAVATAYCPTGPARSRLDRAQPRLHKAGITLYRVARRHDCLSWPHTNAGFFRLKNKIPALLKALNLAR